jgi:hypothetical protein
MMACTGQPNGISQSTWRIGMIKQIDEQDKQFMIVRTRNNPCQSTRENFKLAMPVVNFVSAAIHDGPRPAVSGVDQKSLTL